MISMRRCGIQWKMHRLVSGAKVRPSRDEIRGDKGCRLKPPATPTSLSFGYPHTAMQSAGFSGRLCSLTGRSALHLRIRHVPEAPETFFLLEEWCLAIRGLAFFWVYDGDDGFFV